MTSTAAVASGSSSHNKNEEDVKNDSGSGSSQCTNNSTGGNYHRHRHRQRSPSPNPHEGSQGWNHHHREKRKEDDVDERDGPSFKSHHETEDEDEPQTEQQMEQQMEQQSQALSFRHYWHSLGPYVVLLTCMFASGFTFIASWSCNTFYGAEMTWLVGAGAGGGYGIWSLQDSMEHCQLWSVLFFSYELDAPLRAARFASMTAMLTSLACIAILTQIIACGKVASWIVAIALVYWLGDSISYWWRFNIWSTFFILTYFLFLLLVKSFFLQQQSPQTMWKIGQRCFVVCTLSSAGIFLVLLSNVCMCDELTEKDLEASRGSSYTSIVESDLYESPEHCSGTCVLGPTSHTAVTTPFLWLTAWILSRLLPPTLFSDLTGNQVANIAYLEEVKKQEQGHDQQGQQHQRQRQRQRPQEQELNAVALSGTEQGKQVPKSPKGFSSISSNPRPRLGTAATFGTSTEEDDDDDDDSEEDRLADFSTWMRSSSEDDAVKFSAPPINLATIAESPTDDSNSLLRKGATTDASPTPCLLPEGNVSSVGDDGKARTMLAMSRSSCHSMSPCSTEQEYPAIETSTCSRSNNDDLYDEKVNDHRHQHDSSETDNVDQYPVLNHSDSSISTITHDFYKRKASKCRRVRHFFLGLVMFLDAMVVVTLMGAYFENKRAGEAPETSYNFVTDVVCGFHPLDPTLPFETFDTTAQAELAGYSVAHCGACGECSNLEDIETYVDTRKTVAESAKKCSVQAVFGTDEELIDCLEREIGFTRPCTGCWADNMRSTVKYCMWTCLSSLLTGIASSNTVEDAYDYDMLNQCVFCDEKRSGPAFVSCSGVARRRLGIQSEFERNPLEQCPNVQIDYLSANWTNYFPQLSYDDDRS